MLKTFDDDLVKIQVRYLVHDQGSDCYEAYIKIKDTGAVSVDRFWSDKLGADTRFTESEKIILASLITGHAKKINLT